jgi:hypothetical protein
MPSPQQPPPDPQAAQAGLAVALSGAVLALWPSLDLSDLRGSLPAFKAAVALEVRRHALAAATLATRQYRAQRVAAGVSGGYTPVPADPPPVEQVAEAVDWATQPLWNADVVEHAAAGGTTDLAAPEAPAAPTEAPPGASTAIADAKARLAAATEQQVLDAGRETIVENAQRDRRAKGFARIPEPGACSFCALLATRGAVYKSDSFKLANAQFHGLGVAKTHDNCRCHMEPVFSSYEPSAQVREWQATYKRVVIDEGRTGDDALIAFRQAIEGRPVTGKKDTGVTAKREAGRVTSKPGERGPEQIRAELNALVKNQPNLTNDQQREYTQSRISALRKLLGE